MDWKALGETIAGGALIAASPFTGGATLAPGIGLATGGIAAFGGDKAKTQAQQGQQSALSQEKQGTNVQQDYLHQGIQGQAQVANQQMGNLTPYTSLGSGAAGLLGKGLGVNVSPAPAFTGVPVPGAAAPPNLYPSYGAPPPTLANPSGGFTPTTTMGPGTGGAPAQAMPRTGVPGQLVPGGSLSSFASTANANAARSSSFVTMRAPTGETAQIPANQVPHYQQMGAMVVS